MRLDEVIATADGVAGGVPDEAATLEITGLAYDSRAVAPGSLFFCVSGFQSDGHDFAGQAVERGAAALVVERPLGLGVPEVVVGSARAAMGPAAVRFYGDPSAELRVVGVTGTNGKTTTAFLLQALLEAADPGSSCGLLGTVKSVIGGVERAAGRTTPEAIDLQADFRAMLDGGDGACAIEVSSHALQLGRADAVHFAAAIFTNLTQDHLDFHEDMEDYFQAKRRLFATDPGVSVVNVGDPYGRRLAGEIDGALITFAVERGGNARDRAGEEDGEAGERDALCADYRATDVRCDFGGCHFALHTPAGAREVALPLAGRFNVANALGALATAHALGGELDVLVGGLERGVRVPGRFEAVDEGQDFAVLVDYAHTPDSLENVLGAARDLTGTGGAHGDGAHGEGEQDEHGGAGRVICVFGAGGDRDRGKRPLMGEIAARLADIAIVTSDNPRSEQPEAIIAEILAGAEGVAQPQGARPIASIPDRRAAIFRAVAVAAPGDVLVIAGKGHEQGQEFAAGRKLPFDDVEVARDALHARLDDGGGDSDGERAGSEESTETPAGARR
jgi:UDP-N-acetylmuramoyl-L-alanyl-D-glutamate--2,6-diaminopimelate ligase